MILCTKGVFNALWLWCFTIVKADYGRASSKLASQQCSGFFLKWDFASPSTVDSNCSGWEPFKYSRFSMIHLRDVTKQWRKTAYTG